MSLTGPGPHRDLLGGPPPTLLPEEPEPRDLLERGGEPADVAAAHPTSSLAWAVLAERAYAREAFVEAYAYARTGYHRGLDVLRRAGWRGQGPIPASHVPNQGFLRALLALSEAAHLIGEEDEAERCAKFLVDSGTSVDEVRALTSTTK